MKNQNYSVKISPQGQITLPADVRRKLGVKAGSRITLKIAGKNAVKVDSKQPIDKYFGKFQGAWTKEGQDAAEYVRELRKNMGKKLL